MSGTVETAQLLAQSSRGDAGARDRLIRRVYEELRALATHYMGRERSDHTLQATAVVHEAFIRLFSGATVDYQGRVHFMGMASQAIRHVLIDHARQRLAAKRGGGTEPLALDDGQAPFELTPAGLIELDEALSRLHALSERQARVVELRFFGGLSIEETADLLGISPATVGADWRCARAWLREQLKR